MKTEVLLSMRIEISACLLLKRAISEEGHYRPGVHSRGVLASSGPDDLILDENGMNMDDIGP